MIVVFVFAVLAIIGALVAAISDDARKVILSLWVCGMSIGAVFLSFGAELLAVAQWIVITLVGIALLLFSSMFGELGAKTQNDQKRARFDFAQAALIGGLLIGVLGVALIKYSPAILTEAQAGQDLQALGLLLTERHLISLEVLAVTLLLILVGGGVLARPER
jgi:NADH:ubiquinone oxidoreductase subunit 6 (subunit J)